MYEMAKVEMNLIKFWERPRLFGFHKDGDQGGKMSKLYKQIMKLGNGEVIQK
jgi:hypothetical protein